MKTSVKRRVSRGNLSMSPEYRVWWAMRNRCSNPKVSNWKRYGGRGIKVCERWAESFESFVADMGVRPSADHSIDRIDNDGDYTPSNCRWVDRATQMNNRETSVKIEVNGEIRTKSEWAKHLGLSRCSIENRLRRGWSTERTFSERNRHENTF